jgi:simple sugar transport system ATP-binding protein
MLGRDAFKDSTNSLPAEAQPIAESQTPETAAPVVDAKGLARKGSVQPFNLKIFPGEVVGLAGLLGSGRSEIGRLICGVDRATAGTLDVQGTPVTNWTTRAAIDAGIVWCPEDRKLDGVITQLSVRENIVLAMQAARSVFKPLRKSTQIEIANRYIDRLKIKMASQETPVGALSGGNQQKVLLARWLAMKPKLIILDEPTRGIDVGAKTEIENLVASLSASGVAVLLISSELEDLVRACSRVMVLRDRKIVASVDKKGLNEPTIMKLIAQHDD